MPQHRWPHYSSPCGGWLPAAFDPKTRKTLVSSVSFERRIETAVEQSCRCAVESDGEVNAVRISGRLHLTATMKLGATNALNGDKVVAVDSMVVRKGEEVHALISYTMGGGLSSFAIRTT
jgi:hypothetical protein